MRFIFVFCVKLTEEYISLCFSPLTGSGGRQLSAMGLMPASQLESVFAITVILMMAATASVNFTSKLNTFFLQHLITVYTPNTDDVIILESRLVMDAICCCWWLHDCHACPSAWRFVVDFCVFPFR